MTNTDVMSLRQLSSSGLSVEKFITKDEDGDSCFSLVDGKCPFLNNDGLCKIRLKYSQAQTPEVCRIHPLFIEEYNGFTENCPSLSCPAVCRDVFGGELSAEAYPVPNASVSDELLEILIKSRTEILRFITYSDIKITELFNAFLDCACLAQYCDETAEAFTLKSGESSMLFGKRDYSGYLASDLAVFLDSLKSNCEILTDNWRGLLSISVKHPKDFMFLNGFDGEMKKHLMYLTYRFWLKAINNSDIVGTAVFIVLSVLSVANTAFSSNKPYSEVARLYSKEIEHDIDNSDTLLDLCSELGTKYYDLF